MVKLKTIQSAMREAMTRGVDPRNSHEVQARVLQRRWKMESARRRSGEADLEVMVPGEWSAMGGGPKDEFLERSSEADANRYLSMFLRKQAG